MNKNLILSYGFSSVLIIFCFNFVSGLFVEDGAIYDDGCYNYTANRDFNVTSLSYSDCDFLIDDVDYCLWENKSFFDSGRVCFNLLEIYDESGNLVASIDSSGDSTSIRDIRIGSTSTFNASVSSQGEIIYVWVNVWQNVISGAIKYVGYLSEVVSGIWTVDVPINSTFSVGEYNYTIYSNVSSGVETSVSGIFNVGGPVLDSVSISTSSGENTLIENIVASVDGLEPSNADVLYQWYRDSEGFVNYSMRIYYDAGFSETGVGVALDSSGNIYVVGISQGYHAIKYDSSGEEVWSASYDNGFGEDIPYGIAVDSSGNVYVTGSSYNGLNNDYYTIKYDSSGNEDWGVRYDSGKEDVARDIILDSSGNVYVTGSSYNGLNNDYYTIKYDSSGNEVWNNVYDSEGIDNAYGIAVDSSGNVYVTGESNDGSNSDYYTIKYNLSGEEIWNVRYDGEDYEIAYDLAVDSFENVYVVGSVYDGVDYDYYTIKYDSSGDQVWNVRYDGGNGDDNAYGVDVDLAGNVYVTGESFNGEDYDYYTVKYDSSGEGVWDINCNCGVGDDNAYDIVVDSFGDAFVIGESGGDNEDFLVVKYVFGGDVLDSSFTKMGEDWFVVATPVYYDNVGESVSSGGITISSDCPPIPMDWDVPMNLNLVVDDLCNLTGYNITLFGEGSLTINDVVLVDELNNLSSGMTVWMSSSGEIRLGEK